MFRWELIVSVPWCSAQPSETVYSQLSMLKLQSTQVNVLKKSKVCVRGEGTSVPGRILVKRTGLTLHEPITSAHRISFLQNCHHYCVFSADKSVRLCPGDLSRMCLTYACVCVPLIVQQAVSINTFNQKHTWPDLQQAFQHHSEHTLDIGPLSLPKPEPPTGPALFCQITEFSVCNDFSRLIFPSIPFSPRKLRKIRHSANHHHNGARKRRQPLFCTVSFLITLDVQEMFKDLLRLVTIHLGSLPINQKQKNMLFRLVTCETHFCAVKKELKSKIYSCSHTELIFTPFGGRHSEQRRSCYVHCISRFGCEWKPRVNV